VCGPPYVKDRGELGPKLLLQAPTPLNVRWLIDNDHLKVIC
jgi:hypothetical protein